MECLWGGEEGRLGPRNDLGRLSLKAFELRTEDSVSLVRI